MVDDESPRRRRVLRASAAAGLAALGWPLADASAGNRAGAQDDSNGFAFSYGLQSDSRFEVLTRLQTAEGDAVTEEIPEDCFDDDDESREYEVVIVRAFVEDIRLGYTGLFVPPDALVAQETTTPTEETTTAMPENETTVAETTPTTAQTTAANETTPGEGTTTPGGNATTEAAMQDETTTPGNETTPAVENETTATETTPAAETTTTSAETAELPQIRVGEWYRVTDLTACGDLNRLSLEPTEPRTTQPEA